MNEETTIKLLERLSEISERLAKVETMLSERQETNKEILKDLESHEERIKVLEMNDTSIFTTKNIVTWGIMAVIAAWGVFK